MTALPRLAMTARVRLLALLPLLVALVTPGCHADAPDTVVALVDVSRSAAADSMRQVSRATLDDVLAALGEGDRLVVLRISDHSTADGARPVRIEMPTQHETRTNALTVGPRLDAARAEAASDLGRLLAHPPTPCTDLLGSLDLAAREFQALPAGDDGAAPPRTLVVLSDMVATCGALAFSHAVLADPEAAVEALRTAGRVPDLDGVTVHVAGAGTSRDLSPDALAAIERFWMAFFRAAGASLTPAHYGPTLRGSVIAPG